MTRRNDPSILSSIYQKLREYFGPRGWWPADTPFEVCVGAILTQNTSWKNVVRAIENLRINNALDCKAIYRMNHDELAQLIKPAGYFNVKARRLKNFINLVEEKYAGNLENLFNLQPTESIANGGGPSVRTDYCSTHHRHGSQAAQIDDAGMLRKELLSVNGIGKETADSMILYAAEMPVFVIDVYTRRVLTRHNILHEKADYDEAQALFHDSLQTDTTLFNDFHAQFVAVGNRFCSKTPKCDGCPLKDL